MGLVFLIGTVVLAISFGRIGILEAELAGLSLMGVAPALTGVRLGQRLRRRLSARAVQRWTLLALVAIRLHLLMAVF